MSDNITKKLTHAALWTVGITAGIHAASMLTLDRIIQYKEVSYTSPKLPRELDGYVIAFISDIHSLPQDKLREAVRRINRRGADLLLLGGDFLNKPDGAWPAIEILSGVKARDGAYGVKGNHDYRNNLFAAMTAFGMKPLFNSGKHVRPGFFLGGTADLKNGKPDVKAALAGAEDGDFALLLAHQPDITMFPDAARADLALCGHTHGGHVNVFGLWSPPLGLLRHISDYGQKFRSGFTKTPGGTDVFVSNGIGGRKIPRVFARPQVVFLTLRSNDQ
jgi:predicted MPP superfamily phosphohydrolase